VTHWKKENDSLESSEALEQQPLQSLEGYRKERMQLRILSPIKAIVYDYEAFWFAFLPQKAKGL
jgi:hypothetical protein